MEPFAVPSLRENRTPPGEKRLEFFDFFREFREQQSKHEVKVEEILKAVSRSLEEAMVRAMDMRFQHWCYNSRNSNSLVDSPVRTNRFPRLSEISFPGVVDDIEKEEVIELSSDMPPAPTPTQSQTLARTHSRNSKEKTSLHMSRTLSLSDEVDDCKDKVSTGRKSKLSVPSLHAQVEAWRIQREELLKNPDASLKKRHQSVVESKSSLQGRIKIACEYLIKTRKFELSVATLIVFSAASIGLQEDWHVRHAKAGEKDAPLGFEILASSIDFCFAVELIIRLLAEGSLFFWYTNKNFNWNIFDLFLVFCSILDEVVKRLASTASGGFGAARLLRLMRLIRVVRIIRVLRVFRELRVMVTGIMSSAKPLVWAIILLLIIIFIFSVSILPFVRDEMLLIYEGSDQAATTNIDGVVISDSFGSLFSSMATLFLAISGGVDWGDVAHPLAVIHPLLGLAFAVYIAFACFCVLNIITGVFVETASRLSSMDEDLMVAEEIDTRLSWYEDVKDLFDQANVNEDGVIDSDEFFQLTGKMRIQSRFRKLGVEVTPANAKAIFNLLDIDDSGTIDLEKFALGIQQFHGHAKGLDIARVRLDNKKLGRQIANLDENIRDIFERSGIFHEQERMPAWRSTTVQAVDSEHPSVPPICEKS